MPCYSESIIETNLTGTARRGSHFISKIKSFEHLTALVRLVIRSRLFFSVMFINVNTIQDTSHSLGKE